jgi:hypothetical protein
MDGGHRDVASPMSAARSRRADDGVPTTFNEIDSYIQSQIPETSILSDSSLNYLVTSISVFYKKFFTSKNLLK